PDERLALDFSIMNEMGDLPLSTEVQERGLAIPKSESNVAKPAKGECLVAQVLCQPANVQNRLQPKLLLVQTEKSAHHLRACQSKQLAQASHLRIGAEIADGECPTLSNVGKIRIEEENCLLESFGPAPPQCCRLLQYFHAPGSETSFC